jgi:2-oxo-3-hexenedioate decarboxylase
MTVVAASIDLIAAEALAATDSGRQIAPFSAHYPGFDMDAAYAANAAVRRAREARGEKVVGRKIGFTNRTIWAEYGVYAPNWGYVYDSTVHELAEVGAGFSLARLAEPRVEPEIMFGIARAPDPDMTVGELFACIEWVAHGFEIVQSIFPGWKFAPADTTAANALHGALIIGPRHAVSSDPYWVRALETFDIELRRNGAPADRGRAANVLDGPLHALRHLVELLAGDRESPPLQAGEIVTTGTLTRALPVAPGETWSTSLSGIAFAGVTIRFA